MLCAGSTTSTAISQGGRTVICREPVSDLEAQDIRNGDAVQVPPHLPGGQSIRGDKFVDGFSAELPAVTKLRYGQPRWTGRQ